MVTASCGLMPPLPTLEWTVEYYRREEYKLSFWNLLKRENGILNKDEKAQEQVRKLSDVLKEVEEHAVLDDILLNFVDSRWWNNSFWESRDTFNCSDFPSKWSIYSAVYWQALTQAEKSGIETTKDAYNMFVNKLQNHQRVVKRILNNEPLGLIRDQVKNFWGFMWSLCEPPPVEYDNDDDDE